MTTISGSDLERMQRERAQQEGEWHRPPQRNDFAVLNELCAVYACGQFCCQIHGSFIEAIMGEWVELFLPAAGVNRRVTLARKPPHSKAQLAPNGIRLIPDVPGLYNLCMTLNDHWSRIVHVVAFPKEVERHLNLPDHRDSFKRRMRLRSIVRDRRVTPETIVDSLEGDDPMFGMGGRIVGGGRPLPPGSSVDGAKSVAFSVQNYCSQ